MPDPRLDTYAISARYTGRPSDRTVWRPTLPQAQAQVHAWLEAGCHFADIATRGQGGIYERIAEQTRGPRPGDVVIGSTDDGDTASGLVLTLTPDGRCVLHTDQIVWFEKYTEQADDGTRFDPTMVQAPQLLWSISQVAAYWDVSESRARAILSKAGIRRAVSGYPAFPVAGLDRPGQGARTDLRSADPQ